MKDLTQYEWLFLCFWKDLSFNASLSTGFGTLLVPFIVIYLIKNPTQNQCWKVATIPDSDRSAFLGFGAGEGDSLFSVLLCLGAKEQKSSYGAVIFFFLNIHACFSALTNSKYHFWENENPKRLKCWKKIVTWCSARWNRATAFSWTIWLLRRWRSTWFWRWTCWWRWSVPPSRRACRRRHPTRFTGRTGYSSFRWFLWWWSGTWRGGRGATTR